MRLGYVTPRNSSALMAPFYIGPRRFLSPDDIQGIQSLYGGPGTLENATWIHGNAALIEHPDRVESQRFYGFYNQIIRQVEYDQLDPLCSSHSSYRGWSKAGYGPFYATCNNGLRRYVTRCAHPRRRTDSLTTKWGKSKWESKLRKVRCRFYARCALGHFCLPWLRLYGRPAVEIAE